METISDPSYAMLESTLSRIIDDIGENPSRGLRQLIDMTRHFSHVHLDDRDTACRAKGKRLDNMVLRFINRVGKARACRFGLDLGYNAFFAGAKTIEANEDKLNMRIPWIICHDCRLFDGMPDSKNAMEEIIGEAENLGIFVHCLFVSDDDYPLDGLINIMQANPMSVFFVFASPRALLACDRNNFRDIGNGAFMVLADKDFPAAAGMLYDARTIYGTYSLYNNQNIDRLTSKDYLSRIDKAGGFIHFYVKAGGSGVDDEKDPCAIIGSGKSLIYHSYFIVDFHKEIQTIGNAVFSGNDIPLEILPDGTVIGRDGLSFDIRETGLKEAIKRVMPEITCPRRQSR